MDISTQGLAHSKPFPAPELCGAFAFYSFAPPGLQAPSTARYALSAHLNLSWDCHGNRQHGAGERGLGMLDAGDSRAQGELGTQQHDIQCYRSTQKH